MEDALAVRNRFPSSPFVLCARVAAVLALAQCVAAIPVIRPEPRCWDEVTRVEVDQIRGEECSGLERLDNLTCSDLQTVLLSIADARTVSECVEVLVYPGTYRIDSKVSINNQSLIVRGVGNVTVTFDFASFDPTQTFDPFYVLLLANLEYAEISGIDFTSSPGIVALENISTVVVFDCSFRYFYQGALDVYKSNLVYIGNCTFEHNGPVSVFKAQQYRGHAGGLSLGTEEEGPGSGEVFFMVTDCVFRNNTSTPPPDDLGATTRLFMDYVFSGRGGGCSILMNTSFPANATVVNCNFEDNGATNFAGGIYLGFSGYSSHEINITRTKFVRNRSQGTAGALQYGSVESFVPGEDIVLLLSNSDFVENSAHVGGGTHFFAAGQATPDGRLTHFARVENCTFTRNSAGVFGAAMAAATLLLLQYTGGITPLEIVSCEYINNTAGSGGTVSTAYFPLSFLGANTFRGTKGRTLVVLGARVEVHGDMQFVGNGRGALNAGALYLTSLAQVELFPGAGFLFEGNTGVIGAAVEVSTHQIPAVFSQLTFNPLCAFTYSNSTQSPETWNVSMNFTGNRAVYASAVFINNINLCSWMQLKNPFFDPNGAFRWNFVTLWDNCNSAHMPDECNPEYAIQTAAVDIDILTDEISAYPGESVSIPLKTFDELGRPSAAAVRLSNAELDVIFSPSAIIFDQINSSVITTKLALAEETATSHHDKHIVTAETVLSEVVRRDTLYLATTTCPPGYTISSFSTQEYHTCMCDINNTDITDCNVEAILLEYGLWGARGSNSDQLVTYPCPPQYCRCQQGLKTASQNSSATCEFAFDSQNPDLQCNCARKGTLCGECKDSRGVSVLLNYCVTCHNAYGILVVGLVLADIVALIVIFLVNRQLPDFIYPCLFYLQVLPFLAAFFPVTFEKVHPYLLYISSALSFYFVYDFCLYENMSPLVSYFMKYFPLFVSIISASVFIAVRYRYKLFRVPWHGLWWVILLQYTHVVHTSMSILNCPTIESQNSTGTSWFVSGDIDCFHGWHAPLAVLAVLSLILCVGAVVITVVYAMDLFERPRWIRSFVLPLRNGIGRKYPFWPAVELGRRLLLVLFIVAFPGNDYPAIFILTVFIATFGYLQPYKHLSTNILEVLLCIIVLTMLLLRNTRTLTEEFQTLKEVNGNSTGDSCSDQVGGVTDLAILLATLYYAVLGISLCVAAPWAFSYLRALGKCEAKPQALVQDDSDSSDLDYSEYEDHAGPTTTYITLSSNSYSDSLTVVTCRRGPEPTAESSTSFGESAHPHGGT